MRGATRETVHQSRQSASDTCFNESSLASQKCWRQSRAQGDERDEPRVMRTRKSLGRARLAHNVARLPRAGGGLASRPAEARGGEGSRARSFSGVARSVRRIWTSVFFSRALSGPRWDRR